MEHWLYSNIGHGGRWLLSERVYGNIKPEPEIGDNWGFWVNYNGVNIAILDEQKASWFSLRWQ